MRHVLEWLIVFGCFAPFVVIGMRRRLDHYLHFTKVKFDRTRLGSAHDNEIWEVVEPPFWNVSRLLLRRKTSAVIDFMVPDERGKPRLMQLRGVRVEEPHDRCPLCKRPYKKP